MADNLGFLEQFGLTSLTRDEVETRRRRALMTEARERGQAFAGTNPGEQAMSQVGAMLAEAVNQKFVRGELVSESEGNKIDAVQNAQKRVEEAMQRNPKFAGLSGEAKQNVFQQILADELSTRGLINEGLQVGAQLEQKRKAQRLQDVELDKAGISLERAETANEIEAIQLTEAQRGKVTNLFRIGGGPNDSETVYLNADGEAHTLNGEPFDMEGYTTARPLAGAKEGSQEIRDFVTPRQQATIRAKQRAIAAKMGQARVMREAITESIGDGGTVDIMDGAGAITSGVTKLVDGLQAVGRTLANTSANTVVTDSSGKEIRGLTNRSAAAKFVSNDIGALDALLINDVPEHIRNDQRAREKYYAALVQMTYAQALSQEGGSARSLSDNDFKNAMKALAGSTSDPETFREVTLGGIQRDLKDFELWRKQLGSGLFDQIIRPEANAQFNEDRDAFMREFEVGFGSAAAPGPGLGDASAPQQDTIEFGGAGTLQFDTP